MRTSFKLCASVLLICPLFHSSQALRKRETCRSVPGSAGFPSASTWSAFNETISGRLVEAVPSAKYCATLPGGCTEAQWTRDVPIYSVEAQTAGDIQAAIKFASAHNLRFAVKSSGHDFLGRSTASILGLSIAEGDVLGLCIRLASELLLERYRVPASTHASRLLARHEQGLFAECQAILHQTGGHRSADFNNLVLPKSELIVRAIGHRMAYDAAVDAKLDPTITNLYLASTVPLDASWYAEHAGSGGARQDAAVDQQ
ncbi:hypothetical protein DFH06DRAFT_1298289 [Mycena polygramma]|nr:hypothetical protein DFH06DRAFT_1298289 [Mycena polygramma]